LIVGRTIAAVTAAVALATATMLCVVAATCALFWVLEPLVGRAGAAALLAGVLALIVAICVLIAVSRTGHPQHHHQAHSGPTDFAFVDRLIEMAKDRPLLSAGAALAAGLIAIRNPALVATIVAAFMDKPKTRD
jgi:uncharacterized membrane protein